MVTTSFAGIVGQQDIALSGGVFVRSEAEVRCALRHAHSNCPTAMEPGGVIEGVIGIHL